MIKESVIKTYVELFSKGEMLKGHEFINKCVPLELIDDPDISLLRDEANARIDEIKSWNKGREYTGTFATVEFDNFPKFVLARERILDKFKYGKILDIGCYSCDFLKGMAKKGFTVYGIDIHGELLDKIQRQTTSTLRFGSAEDIPYPKNFFDVVTAFDVLEHVIDFDASLSEIERVCEKDGLIIINLPRMTYGYRDEAFEHLRMFSDKDIERIWGNKKDYKLEICADEHGRPTSFITYNNA